MKGSGSLNQAKVQLWQLVSGQMVPAGTEFAIPLHRANAILVSQWFRKLQNTRRLGGMKSESSKEKAGEEASKEKDGDESPNKKGNSKNTDNQVRWQDVLSHFKQLSKNALLSVAKSHLAKHYNAEGNAGSGGAGGKSGGDGSQSAVGANANWMEEPATAEHFFLILWPVEGVKNMQQIRQWLLSFELQEHNKRIKVLMCFLGGELFVMFFSNFQTYIFFYPCFISFPKFQSILSTPRNSISHQNPHQVKPPPVLPQEKQEEVEAMYEYVVQDLRQKAQKLAKQKREQQDPLERLKRKKEARRLRKEAKEKAGEIWFSDEEIDPEDAPGYDEFKPTEITGPTWAELLDANVLSDEEIKRWKEGIFKGKG